MSSRELGDPDRIDDDVLRLVFVACHPVLSAEARLALTLRTVAGLTTEQIARMLLMTVPAVQQRIVRAKRALAEAAVPFEVPDRAERPARLASVLQVIYLLFTEGYAAGDGRHPIRPDVAREAVRLGRRLERPDAGASPKYRALIALMEFQSSRFAARVDAEGLPITLADQDRRRWDRSAIARGREALARRGVLRARSRLLRAAGVGRRVPRGGAATRDETDWRLHRPTLRRARLALTVTRRAAEPRGRRQHGRGPGSRLCARSTLLDAELGRVPAAARRARRAARAARADGCRRRRVPGRSGSARQRCGGRGAAASRPCARGPAALRAEL